MSYRERHADLHQEEDRVPAGWVILSIVVVLIVSLVLIVWAHGLVRDAFADLRPTGAFPERSLGPRRPEARVRQDLFDERGLAPTLNQVRRAELESFGWVDRPRGVVRIPIERAIDLVSEENKR